MKTRTIEVYEVLELSPAAFEKAHREYCSNLYDDDGVPWEREIMDSLKAIFRECQGVKLRDWSIGIGGTSFLSVSFSQDVAGGLTGKRAIAWLENNLLSRLRLPAPITITERQRYKTYGYKTGEVKSCSLTSVCFDDDFLNSLVDEVREGATLRRGFEGLAQVAQKLIEGEYNHQRSEEGFREMAEANGYEFDKDGNRL